MNDITESSCQEFEYLRSAYLSVPYNSLAHRQHINQPYYPGQVEHFLKVTSLEHVEDLRGLGMTAASHSTGRCWIFYKAEKEIMMGIGDSYNPSFTCKYEEPWIFWEIRI